MQAGGKILVADGSLTLEVLLVQSDTEVHCKCLNSKTLGQRKNVNLPGRGRHPSLTGTHACGRLILWHLQPSRTPHKNVTSCDKTPVMTGSFDPAGPPTSPIGVHVDIPVLTAKDTEDLQQFCVKNNMDFVAASFVQANIAYGSSFRC